jgi:FkbM family methyltransferase
MSDVWTFRPGTLDRLVVNDVVCRNEYQLPDCFHASDVIIDVGAHIGCFAYAAIQRGSRQVHCYEPDRDNCRRTETHLREYLDAGWVQLSELAVWRSDRNDDELRFDGYQPFPKSFVGMEGIINTGNGSVLWGSGEVVAKVALDEAIDRITSHGARRIRMLKLDCEGAEWPILLTSQRLHLVDEIVGEFHELGGPYLEIGEDRPATPLVFHSDRVSSFTIDELSRVLTESGFTVKHHRHRRPDGALEGLGLFFAVRHADRSEVTRSEVIGSEAVRSEAEIIPS